ncbi:branched-chain amino acid ABC transporter permease, partial [Candidatus Bathyarchaeota archaeon]|nr:branched-chain amino acid ABC transporter permease [Candidatus Bathyarchaeota archaeon]
MIEEIILFGTIKSGVYALLALGFTLIYGISGVVNLAHGSFYMLGAYLFFIIGTLGILGSGTILSSVLALVFAVILVGVIGSVTYRLTIHPVLGDEIAVMVVTVCLALIFQQAVILVFGVTFPP